MEPKNQPISFLRLTPAIDRRPLIVEANKKISEIIAMMGKAYSSCVLSRMGLLLDTLLINQARARAILVTQDSRFLGIFTQKQAIELIATGRDLSQLSIAEVIKTNITITESEKCNIFDALLIMRQHNLQHLPVVDANREITGLVTLASIRRCLPLDDLLKSTELGQIITTPYISAPRDASMLDVARLMAQHQVEFVVMTEENPKGIVTQSDIIQILALELELSEIQAQKLISTDILNFSSHESVLAAYWYMQQENIQEIIVSESSSANPLGIVDLNGFLMTLDIGVMSQTVAGVTQSIDQFLVEKAQHSPDKLISNEITELKEQLKSSRILAAMALNIRQSLDLDTILNTAVEEVRGFLKSDRVLIYRFNPDFSGTVVVESNSDRLQPTLGSSITDTCFGKNYAIAYQQGRIQVTEDIYTEGLSQCHIDILALFNVRASLVVPILQGGNLWGLLCAYQCFKPRCWLEFEIELLKQLATHVAIAIQQSELYEQVNNELKERKRTEDRLKISLKEKEVLLKEVHHRVKNSLQIISSLLNLQSYYIQDELALASFVESQNRIRSMALIHEKLYQSKDLFRIDLAEYIAELTAHLLSTYTANAKEIRVNINADNIWLTNDTIIYCGLIINELVSNAFKYAFPCPKPQDRIDIIVREKNNNNFELIVSDNGVGFPPDLNLQNTQTLGLQLICTFVEQLEGKIELASGEGATFIITFKEIGVRGSI